MVCIREVIYPARCIGIDINDVTLLQRYIAGESVLTDDAVKAADFNKDRIIDIIDATAIQTFIAHGQN